MDPKSVQKRYIKLIEILIEKMTPRGPETAPKMAPKSHFFYGAAVQDFSLRALERPISVLMPFGTRLGSILARFWLVSALFGTVSEAFLDRSGASLVAFWDRLCIIFG